MAKKQQTIEIPKAVPKKRKASKPKKRYRQIKGQRRKNCFSKAVGNYVMTEEVNQ